VPASTLKQLWSINYKQHLLPLLSAANQQTLAWTDHEDQLILHFYFDRSARKQEMQEVLTSKGIAYLIERYRFMNLPVSANLQETLAALLPS
jgi:hypothetical protein